MHRKSPDRGGRLEQHKCAYAFERTTGGTSISLATYGGRAKQTNGGLRQDRRGRSVKNKTHAMEHTVLHEFEGAGCAATDGGASGGGRTTQELGNKQSLGRTGRFIHEVGAWYGGGRVPYCN